jgi:hypothetical protein
MRCLDTFREGSDRRVRRVSGPITCWNASVDLAPLGDGQGRIRGRTSFSIRPRRARYKRHGPIRPPLGYANRQAGHAGPATQAAEQGLRRVSLSLRPVSKGLRPLAKIEGVREERLCRFSGAEPLELRGSRPFPASWARPRALVVHASPCCGSASMCPSADVALELVLGSRRQTAMRTIQE